MSVAQTVEFALRVWISILFAYNYSSNRQKIFLNARVNQLPALFAPFAVF